MKKSFILVPLFVIGFGAAFGLALLSPDQAMAVPLCDPDYCIYELHCSSETGPLCTNPMRPFYLYAINGECTNNPIGVCPDEFAGCCRFPY